MKKEKVQGEIYVVGNTVLDNLLPYKEKCEYTAKVLVTLHRRENHGKMDLWFKAINELAKDNPSLEFILPLHPNPNVKKHANLLPYVTVVEPMDYPDLLNLLVKVRLVITDSGGLQEEGSFFNKKVLVCREATERPEGITTGHLHMCATPRVLKNKFNFVKDDAIINQKCPYGDGKSSQQIKKIL